MIENLIFTLYDFYESVKNHTIKPTKLYKKIQARKIIISFSKEIRSHYDDIKNIEFESYADIIISCLDEKIKILQNYDNITAHEYHKWMTFENHPFNNMVDKIVFDMEDKKFKSINNYF